VRQKVVGKGWKKKVSEVRAGRGVLAYLRELREEVMRKEPRSLSEDEGEIIV